MVLQVSPGQLFTAPDGPCGPGATLPQFAARGSAHNSVAVGRTWRPAQAAFRRKTSVQSSRGGRPRRDASHRPPSRTISPANSEQTESDSADSDPRATTGRCRGCTATAPSAAPGSGRARGRRRRRRGRRGGRRRGRRHLRRIGGTEDDRVRLEVRERAALEERSEGTFGRARRRGLSRRGRARGRGGDAAGLPVGAPLGRAPQIPRFGSSHAIGPDQRCRTT